MTSELAKRVVRRALRVFDDGPAPKLAHFSGSIYIKFSQCIEL